MLERRLLRNLDYVLLGLVFLTMCASLAVIYSASRSTALELGDALWFVKRQALWILLGLGMIYLMLLIDYHDIARFSRVIYIINILLLLAVLLVGREALGAARWLKLGPLLVQPSEFAKIAVIITLAEFLAKREGKPAGLREIAMALLHVSVPMALITLQPDMGTSLVFLAVLFGMLFMAGVSLRALVGGYAGAIAAVVAWVVLHLRYDIPIPLKEYQLKRLIVFVNPQMDPLGAGYHVIQSKIAVGSGQLLGKGFLSGLQNKLNYLPEQHTDFVFSVIGEEFGFVGGLILLLIYFNILWRGVYIASQAKDSLGTLLAAGVVSMIGFHVLVSVGMSIGMMPVTGIPLPFMSYGGSSLLTNSAAIGILLNVHMRRQKIMF